MRFRESRSLCEVTGRHLWSWDGLWGLSRWARAWSVHSLRVPCSDILPAPPISTPTLPAPHCHPSQLPSSGPGKKCISLDQELQHTQRIALLEPREDTLWEPPRGKRSARLWHCESPGPGSQGAANPVQPPPVVFVKAFSKWGN